MPESHQEQDHEQRFCRWVEEYQGVIFRVVHATAFLPEDKNDLFQEILLQLWRSLPSFEGRCRETTWIYRVALNTARTWRRSEKRRREHREQVAAFPDLHEPEGDPPNPLLDSLYEAIRELPKADRSLLLLHLDGLSYEEMAEVMGVTEGCVGVRLTRARKRLGKTMKGMTDEL